MVDQRRQQLLRRREVHRGRREALLHGQCDRELRIARHRAHAARQQPQRPDLHTTSRSVSTTSSGRCPARPTAPNLCNGVSGAIQDPIDGQNCVPTDTGLPANALEEGMITGISGHPGRLRKPATSPCTRSNVTVSGYSLNDDVLSCFFTDPSIRVGDVTKATYTGEPVISPSIFDSPRFVWVPLDRVAAERQEGRLHPRFQGLASSPTKPPPEPRARLVAPPASPTV